VAGTNDHELARSVAHEAGARLLDLRTGGALPQEHLGAEGDAHSHRLIVKRLRQYAPSDAIRSEEGKQRDTSAERRVWIVDPLDGTREYAEGREDWAVHVALWEDGALVAGAVALPALGDTLCTGSPASPPPSSAQIRVVVSRSRPPEIATAVAEALDGELVKMGSAGAKAAAVVRGAADVYVHAGGQYEWDSAAPVAVATAASFHVSRLDGSRLVYNCADPWLPDLVVCRAELAPAVLQVTSR
jgi:3'(2'), 5'-bisphosphate nucleotidase